uniref:AMP-binding domain-containing protein n=1 Tax=Angiostrongylus cantonensis TaxID=6313 RepID=A0A0K0D449_ANGCA
MLFVAEESLLFTGLPIVHSVKMLIISAVPTVDSKPTLTNLSGKAFTPFASVQLLSARISLDVFIDGHFRDLTFIFCVLAQIAGGTKSLFGTILQPRKKCATESFPLMFETHIMMRKDEAPVITLVLMQSKLLMMYDWLNDVKNFVTQSTDFVPKGRWKSVIVLP